VISLAEAKTLIASALDKGAELGLKPLTVAVLDNGGCLKALECQDGASILRPKIAFGKAYGASRALHTRAEQQPYFVSAINALADGALVPVAGGVLIRDDTGHLIGAIGITGDTSDNDEACAVAAITAAGFTPETG
jgi:uncharacterized protein GlcG (DUF336 family)